jgi:hypothetical protein
MSFLFKGSARSVPPKISAPRRITPQFVGKYLKQKVFPFILALARLVVAPCTAIQFRRAFAACFRFNHITEIEFV